MKAFTLLKMFLVRNDLLCRLLINCPLMTLVRLIGLTLFVRLLDLVIMSRMSLLGRCLNCPLVRRTLLLWMRLLIWEFTLLRSLECLLGRLRIVIYLTMVLCCLDSGVKCGRVLLVNDMCEYLDRFKLRTCRLNMWRMVRYGRWLLGWEVLWEWEVKGRVTCRMCRIWDLIRVLVRNRVIRRLRLRMRTFLMMRLVLLRMKRVIIGRIRIVRRDIRTGDAMRPVRPLRRRDRSM